jgi:hypothetical protein
MSALHNSIFKSMVSINIIISRIIPLLNNSIFRLLPLFNLTMNWINFNNKICNPKKE